MPIIRVIEATAVGGRVQAGYEYDDRTEIVTSILGSNNAARAATVSIRGLTRTAKSITRGLLTESLDVSSLRIQLVRDRDGYLGLPAGMGFGLTVSV